MLHAQHGMSHVRSCTVRRDVSFAPRRGTVSPLFGGILGLAYPSGLILMSLSVGSRAGGDMGDFAASLVGAALFVVAAPTTWILSFPFIEVTRFTVFIFGVVTSLPLWYIVGMVIARQSANWLAWFGVYGIVCVGWTAANLVFFGLIATVAG